MNGTRTLALIGLLAPLMAGADALDAYGLLKGKTVLFPAALPLLPDSIVPDSLADTNKAIAAIERAFAEKGLEVVQDGPHFVRVLPQGMRDFMTNAPLRGAELALAKGQESWSKGQEALPAGMIDFSGADLRQVLDICALMSGRTILRPAILPAPVIRLRTACSLTKEEGVYALETVLALNGICVVDDGAKFVQVVVAQQRAQVRTRAPKSEPGAETMPAGSINFRGADLGQVLSIYASMSQRTILRPATLPGPVVSLQSASALTRQEAVYAMATVFELNGISLVDDGEKFVQVLPMAQRATVKTNAPKPDPGAKLFDPKKVPAVGISRPAGLPGPSKPLNDMERLEQEFERLRKAVYDFMHITGPNRHSPQRLLELYARLADKTAVASTNFDRVPIHFQVETPVTRSELLYAIETTLTLNNLAIIPVDDRRIRLGWIREVLRSNGERLQKAGPKNGTMSQPIQRSDAEESNLLGMRRAVIACGRLAQRAASSCHSLHLEAPAAAVAG
jgi:hypothetical protein